MPRTPLTHPTPQQQLPLLPLDEELLLRKARELFDSSHLLQERWPSFDKALAHPSVGRCLRMSAAALLRRSSKKSGSRRR